MGSTLYEELGVTQETVAEAGSQSISAGVAAPGVYDAIVDQAYIRKTDSGAKMFEIDMTINEDGKDRKFHYTTCTHAGYKALIA